MFEGRKCPLREIREKTLEELREYMRASTNGELEAMASETVINKLIKLNEIKEGENTLGNLKKHLMDLERTRHLLVWHGLSTVANHSHLIFMVACLYDPAFY